MKNKLLFDMIDQIDDQYILEAAPAPRGKPRWLPWLAAAACLLLLLSSCLGTFAIVAEAKEYQTAVRFFDLYNMSTAGLTRGEIKTIYRDITTNSFTFSKTAEVIKHSISPDHIGGYEIFQEELTPKEVENLWNYKKNLANASTPKGIRYNINYSHHDEACIDQYDGNRLLWCYSPGIAAKGLLAVSDGVIVWGNTPTISSDQKNDAWLLKLDTGGNEVWRSKADHGFEDYEYIEKVLANPNGTYAVFSTGDRGYLCMAQYTANGEKIFSKTTKIDCNTIGDVEPVHDGYLVHMSKYLSNQIIVKLDRQGNITDSFSYGSEDAYYSITDMIEFDGKIYLSGHTVPRLVDEDRNAGGRYEIAEILNYLDDHNITSIPSGEFTPMVRDHFSAILIVCDLNSGSPEEFYSVKGSIGDSLSISPQGMLLWDVGSLVSAGYHPYFSAYSISCTCCIFQYTFDASGALLQQKKTDKICGFYR